MLSVKQKRIGIISDDADFASQVTGRWQSERVVPAFTVLGSKGAPAPNPESFDLAILDVPFADPHRALRGALEGGGRPVILVCGTSEITQILLRESSRVVAVTRHDGWSDFVVLLAMETLRRVDAVYRADQAEQVSALLNCHATLGQYMIEMRHSLNNALTSVLGNSELLLLEPGAFSAGVRSQIDTMRNMSLRMHEILQRFSSLEKELTFVEQQAVKEQKLKPQAAAVSL
jgi:signal transduction histidine kinase